MRNKRCRLCQLELYGAAISSLKLLGLMLQLENGRRHPLLLRACSQPRQAVD